MIEFTLPDVNGVEHNYRVAKIPFGKNVKFARAILAKCIQPLMRLVMAQDTAQAKTMARVNPSDTDSMLDALDMLDMQSLAGDLSEVIADLDLDTLLGLFAYVQRDGFPLDTDETRSNAYDQNWAEFYRASFELVKAQGYLSFTVSSSKT